MNNNEKTCPLCKNLNQCGVNKEESCWCVSKAVPKELIKQVPPEQIDKTCICANCIDEYNRLTN